MWHILRLISPTSNASDGTNLSNRYESGTSILENGGKRWRATQILRHCMPTSYCHLEKEAVHTVETRPTILRMRRRSNCLEEGHQRRRHQAHLIRISRNQYYKLLTNRGSACLCSHPSHANLLRHSMWTFHFDTQRTGYFSPKEKKMAAT